jgi:hypothetical protein
MGILMTRRAGNWLSRSLHSRTLAVYLASWILSCECTDDVASQKRLYLSSLMYI